MVEQPKVEPTRKTPDDTRVESEEDQPIFQFSQKGPRDQTQASRLASTMFRHLPQDPNCEFCELTNTTQEVRAETAWKHEETFFVHLKILVMLYRRIIKNLHEENESRFQHRYAIVVQDALFYWDSKLPTEEQNSARDDEKFAEVLAARSENMYYLQDKPNG